MKILIPIFCFIMMASCQKTEKEKVHFKKQKPNVLFIAIDDLNDWTGLLKGHPQAKTPNLDRLMNRGINFTNAHTAAPHCGPSRNAIFSGLHPSTTGLVQNESILRSSPVFNEDGVTLPQYFMKHGYHALGTGKLLHSLDKKNYSHQLDPQSWHEYFPGKMLDMYPNPLPNQVPMHSIPGIKYTVDWGPLDIPNDEMSDWKNAKWIAEQLKRDFNKPFFMAYGVYRPHLPRYAPKKYFDMFPLNEIILPEVDPKDVEDLPQEGKKLSLGGRLKHEDILKYGEWKSAVQAYLATIAFADDCLGLILDALDASPYKDNTIIAAWSDHGYHLGEKNHWMKFTLWEESTRSVFTLSAPGVTQPRSVHANPVSLHDIYPTLLDLAGLPESDAVDGENLVPILKDPSKNRSRPVLTTFSTRGHAVRSATHRYIRYSDGGEELYDHVSDPNEWDNLVGKPGSAEVIEELKKFLPKGKMPIADKGVYAPPQFTSHSHDKVIIGKPYQYEITFYEADKNNLRVTYGKDNPTWLKNNNGFLSGIPKGKPRQDIFTAYLKDDNNNTIHTIKLHLYLVEP